MVGSHAPSLSEQERYWNTKWGDAKNVNECGAEGHWSRARAETILALLRSLPLRAPRILDFGCGTGWFTDMLSSLGAATGIDLSTSAIATAKSRYPRPTFIAGNLFQIPIPAGDFDVVVSQEVIAHVEDQPGYLDRIADALRPGGYLIISTPNKFVMDRVDFGMEPPGHLERWLTRRHLVRLLQARFRVLRTTSVIFIGDSGILRLLNSPKLNRVASLFLAAPRLDAWKGRAHLGYTLVALAQKSGS
jgi:2-polyprenyl-3-methyl-5-hydroxy-6-metoxy-1,4-benzoquinol methylase